MRRRLRSKHSTMLSSTNAQSTLYTALISHFDAMSKDLCKLIAILATRAIDLSNRASNALTPNHLGRASAPFEL